LVDERNLIKDPIFHEGRDESGVTGEFDDWSQLLQLLFVHFERFWARCTIAVGEEFSEKF
jgi:hypothetical protein